MFYEHFDDWRTTSCSCFESAPRLTPPLGTLWRWTSAVAALPSSYAARLSARYLTPGSQRIRQRTRTPKSQRTHIPRSQRTHIKVTAHAHQGHSARTPRSQRIQNGIHSSKGTRQWGTCGSVHTDSNLHTLVRTCDHRWVLCTDTRSVSGKSKQHVRCALV